MFAYSYGWVQTVLECESNCIEPGQKVKLKFEINTNRMNSKVRHTKIRLLERTMIVTKNFCQEKELSELFSFDFN